MTMITKFPVRRHPNCADPDCEICLDDHGALADYIHDATGADRKQYDMLAEYRKWLDAVGIAAESDTGWATAWAWNEDNVHMFIKEWEG